MSDSSSSNIEDTFWRCSGRGDKWPVEHERHHLEQSILSDKCPICGKPRPKKIVRTADANLEKTEKPKKDIRLLSGLSILNIVSGYTTVQGAIQILSVVPGIIAGATIQSLLFLLLSSRSSLNHSPKLKWAIVSCLSFFSIYTSTFGYYQLLTRTSNIQDSKDRAITAHQNVITDIFTPLESKNDILSGRIAELDVLIQQEQKGERVSAIEGCGIRCNNLKIEREEIQNRLNSFQPILDKLEAEFNYDISELSPENIFNNDKAAIAKVPQYCVPHEPDFDCLPKNYKFVLNTNSPQYKEFRRAYIDRDLAISLLAPFIKILKGDIPAIGAALIALIIDGCIIMLGLGVETYQKRNKLVLNIYGKGSEFIDNILESINSDENCVDSESLLSSDNKREYINLLQSVRAETGWLDMMYEEQKWYLKSDFVEEKFSKWLVFERQRQIQKEIQQITQDVVFYEKTQQKNAIELSLPTKYD